MSPKLNPKKLSLNQRKKERKKEKLITMLMKTYQLLVSHTVVILNGWKASTYA
jgi:hypothetical protein